MNYVIFQGDEIVDNATDLSIAKSIAKSHLPSDYKKGKVLRPSQRTSVWKEIIEYGGIHVKNR